LKQKPGSSGFMPSGQQMNRDQSTTFSACTVHLEDKMQDNLNSATLYSVLQHERSSY